MVTRPKNIVAHLVEGTLGLKTADRLFPGDSPWNGIPLVRFRARAPFSVWIRGYVLDEKARPPGLGALSPVGAGAPISSPGYDG